MPGPRLPRTLCLALLIATFATRAMPASTSAQDAGNDRENPVPLGETVNVGDWTVQVVDVTLDATKTILAANATNHPPAEGNQFAMIRVDITYNGGDTVSVDNGIGFAALGSANVGYSQYYDPCGTYPDPTSAVTKLHKGDSATLNVCWEVSTSDARSLELYVQAYYTFLPRVWFSLGNTVTQTMPTGLKGEHSAPATVSGSTQDEPIPLGERARVNTLIVSVVTTEPRATATIREAFPSHESPQSGHQYFMATISVTNASTDMVIPISEVEYTAVGASGVIYTEFTNSCGLIPGADDKYRDVFPGGTITYSLCWQIDRHDASTLELTAAPAFSNDTTEQAWLALHR